MRNNFLERKNTERDNTSSNKPTTMSTTAKIIHTFTHNAQYVRQSVAFVIMTGSDTAGKSHSVLSWNGSSVDGYYCNGGYYDFDSISIGIRCGLIRKIISRSRRIELFGSFFKVELAEEMPWTHGLNLFMNECDTVQNCGQNWKKLSLLLALRRDWSQDYGVARFLPIQLNLSKHTLTPK